MDSASTWVKDWEESAKLNGFEVVSRAFDGGSFADCNWDQQESRPILLTYRGVAACRGHRQARYLLPIAPPRVDSSMGPKRVNRAHGPTKENRQIFCNFRIFPVHGKNGLGWPQIGPGGFFPY